LTTPELAVVIANVKNRYKRMLSTLPLIQHGWAESLLTPYFPPVLVATRSALAHPLANAILATVLANEAVNRCGPLMLRELALEQGVDEADVMLAWAQAWSALRLAPVFEALDADGLTVPLAASIKVDARTRVLQRTMIAGVLSVPADQFGGAGGLAQLARLFSQPQALQLMQGGAEAVALDPDLASLASLAETPHTSHAAFAQAWQAVDAIESVAGFLFGALAVERPADMDLAALLQLGLALRREVGIGALERGLAYAPHSKSQAQLRNYARRALLRTQQRLLAQLLHRAAGGGDADAAMSGIVAALGAGQCAAHAAPDLEQSMLDVWALSEAAGALEA
jgi:glutamate dehydrogenase